MGLVWFWGGEHGTVDEFDVAGGVAIVPARTGMSGSYCLQTTDHGGLGVTKNLTPGDKYYVGLRWEASFGSYGTNIFTLRNGTNNHVILRAYTDGYLYCCWGNLSTNLYVGTASQVFTSGTCYRIEGYFKIADSEGRIVIKVNGMTVIDYTGDTYRVGSSVIDNIFTGYVTVNFQADGYYDDIVIRDDTWPGDVRVAGKEVSGDSSPQQFLSAGTTHYLAINDTDDSDYIFTNSNYKQELFQLSDVTEPVYQVKGLKLVTRVRTVGSPHPTKIKHVVAAAGMTTLSTGVDIASSYTNLPSIYETNPLTGNPFTVSDIDNLQIGIQSNDPTLVARWSFESEGSKYANSISSYNYLTPVGGTLYVDTDYVREGVGSIKYWYSYNYPEMGYLILEDSNASPDFPLRAGDTQKLITMCGWVYPTTVDSHYPVLFGKAGDWSGQQGIGLQLNGGDLYVLWSYASTPGLTVNQELTTNKVMSANRWYHVAVTANGVDRTCLVRFYDEYNDTASTVNLTFNYQMVIDDGTKPFRIGNSIQGSTYYGYRGYFDDIRVYNRRLSVDEIDLIRQGQN